MKIRCKVMLGVTLGAVFGLLLLGAGLLQAQDRPETFDDYLRRIRISQELLKAKVEPDLEVPTLAKEAEAELTPVLGSDQTPETIIDGLLTPETKDLKMDLDFDGIELGVIMMTLGNTAKMNIVLDPELKSRQMDLHLKQVTVKEGLMVLADSYSLGFKRIGDCLFVSTQEKLREQKLVSKVIRLRNISAEEAKAMIKDLISIINISPGINSLVVVGDPSEIAKVDAVIAKIDRVQPQVILEAKIIEVNTDALRELGVDWSDEISVSYQEKNRPVEFANIETGVAEPFKIFGIARTPIQFNATIKMLEELNKARVLSAPRVTTINNKKAEIFVGDRVPYTVTTISGGVATSDVRFEEPGIRLNITPSIIDNDFVVIQVEPEVSFIYGWRGPSDAYPWTKKRTATANVRVKNQQPFVLGGLLVQADKKNLFRVPIIGEIPLIGNLFKYENKQVEDSELIITVIPTIVPGNQ